MEPSKATAPACEAFLRPSGHACRSRRTNRPPDQQLTRQTPLPNREGRSLGNSAEGNQQHERKTNEKRICNSEQRRPLL